MTDRNGENDRTQDNLMRAVAYLPGLEIEVAHRRTATAEQISIHMQALPSFEAFGRAIASTNPFAFWAEAARLAWLPWLTLNPWLAPLPSGNVHQAPPTIPEG